MRINRILLLLLLTLTIGAGTAAAQGRLIRGRVVDETGLGYPSAGITVRGTQTGTTTDLDGNFQLTVPEGSTTLTIQALGYSSQEATISDNMVIRLQRASKELTGAVVTAQAIRREKRELGYSATTLNTDEINGANQTSALSSLAGKVAGANVTSSTGGPGGSTRVVLRGEKSIGANNNALIVIDGVIVNNGNRLQGRSGLSEIDYGNRGNDVNPEDIESITVLRGPAAAALYGSQAAAGAIMITTKSGRNAKRGPGKTEITYQTSYTLQNILKYPELQSRYGQGNQYRGNIPDDRRENFSWGYEFDGSLRPWGQEINGQTLVKPYVNLENNIKEFFRTGRTWENNVSLAGASDNNSYYLSLNTLNNDGVTPNTFYKKYSVRLNASTQLSNHFYTSVNLNYININQRVEQQGQQDGAVWENVLQTPRDIPMGETRELNNPFYSYGFPDSTGIQRYGYYNAYSLNPFWVAANFDNRTRTDRVLGNNIIGFKKGRFEVFNRMGIDFSADRTVNKIPKYNFVPYDDFYAGNDQISNGGLFEANVNTTTFTNDVIAQYRQDISEDVNLDGLLGHNVTINRLGAITADIDPDNNGLVIPGFYSFTNAKGPVQSINTISQLRSVAVYGSLKLGFKRSVFLELTGRNDWSSSLFENSRAFFYPSANLSWVFTETFQNDFTTNVLTFGKIKANYASVGSGALAFQNNNAAFTRGSIATAFGLTELPFNSIPGYTFQNVIGNPDLRPERTNTYEVGTELGFFRDRMSLDFTYYQNLSIDQILTIPVPASTGYTGKVVNLGDISNRGAEVQLRVTPVKVRNGITWDLFGTYTHNRSRVERLGAGVDQVSFGGTSSAVSVTATIGKPFGAIYAVDLLRDESGRVIVDSASGLPQSTTERIYKGTFQPRFQASWGTTLRYKGWSANILFDTKQGGVFYSSTKDLMAFVGTSKETENREEQVWTNSVYLNSAGDYVTNTTPYLPYDYYTTSGAQPDGQHVVDASYIKLRETSISYTIPAGALKRTPFGSAQLSVFGNNLVIWTSDENKYVDPEVNSQGAGNVQGYDFRARPSLRNYGISLRVSF